MIFKTRSKSNELLTLEFLNKRMHLTKEDKQHYHSLKKGYEGELLFDTYTKKLQFECLILNDLLFNENNVTFQIDSLIITAKILYLYEVKNFEGDYYFEDRNFYLKSNKEVLNPLNQLERCELLLRQLLLRLGWKLPIDASVVFVNPSFTLYQAPLDLPIIFPTQIMRHMNQLNTTSLKLTESHKILANKLLDLHSTTNPHAQIPEFSYDQLHKGITCKNCNSFSVTLERRICVCHECGFEELGNDAILRSVREFKFLFPEEKITTNKIYDWCRVVSKKRIGAILSDNFTIVGSRQWAYYI